MIKFITQSKSGAMVKNNWTLNEKMTSFNLHTYNLLECV